MRNALRKIVSVALEISFLPFIWMWYAVVATGRPIWKRMVALVAAFVLTGVWISALMGIMLTVGLINSYTGGVDGLREVPVEGTSMLPTIPESGSTVKERLPGAKPIRRGDFASFSNQETQGLTYLKRVVGLPGEKVLIKNGLVWVNGLPLSEPYLNHKAPTYGNTFLPECVEKQIPEKSYLLMGDNRAVSWDGRAVGFVSEDDLTGVVDRTDGPTFDSQAKVAIEAKAVHPSTFISKLNMARKERRVQSLMASRVLSEIATKRAMAIADAFDSWKTTLPSIDATLDSAGYRTNLAYEYVTYGNLSDEEVLAQAMEVPVDKDYFLSDRFLEAGVGTAEVKNGDCSYPVTVVVLDWPSVPTYSEDTVSYWAREANVTTEILGDLQSWVGNSQKDQVVLKKAIARTAEMAEISGRIYNRMKNKEWLTERDYADRDRYQSLISANNKDIDTLFPSVKGATSLLMPDLW